MDLGKFWDSMTPAQGYVVASIVTLVAALLSILLGSTLFRNRVRNLEAAIQASEKAIQGHLGTIESSFIEYRASFENQIRDTSTEMVSLFNQLRANIEEASVAADPIESTTVTAIDTPNPRDVFSANWQRIRDKLERISADETIDGRTRARYGRVDRRRMADLVAALDADQRLGGHGDQYRAAVDLRNRFRRVQPSNEAATRMRELADELSK